MRVVHLSTLHSPRDERIFFRQCRTLAAAGYEVHLVAPGAEAFCQEGVHFHPLEKPTTALRPLRILRRWQAVYRRAAALRGHIYHFHDPELILVGLWLKQTGARVIYDVHEHSAQEARTLHKERPWEGWSKALALTALERLAQHTLDAFVCATPAIARAFPPSKTVVVRNFPRWQEFAGDLPGPSYARRPPWLLYAGSISRVRGIREMVQALARLPPHLGARLQLAGTFVSPQLQTEVARLPGWEYVDYLGQQPRTGVQRLLRQARLGLVLYQPESDHLSAEPNKLFEYLAAGLPVVASHFPYWRQLLEPHACACLVDPTDPAAIAQAIHHLLTHPADAADMGRRGQQAVRQQWNWEREAGKLLQLYRRLTAPNDQPALPAPLPNGVLSPPQCSPAGPTHSCGFHI